MQNINWTTQKRKLADLKPYSKNPRMMTDKDAFDLKESIRKFGLVEIPVVNTDNTILAGHMRIRTLMESGEVNEIEVRVPDRKLTVAEAEEYLIRSNKNTGRWDEDKLMDFNKDLLISFGFDKYELSKIWDRKEAKDDAFDPDAVIANLPQPVAKQGELYEIGQHRIMCGDATSPEDFQKLMNGQMAAMTMTDPPYNVDYSGGMGGDGDRHNRDGILNDSMDSGKFYDFLEGACRNIVANCTGGIYICMSSSELHTLKRAFEAAGGHWQTFIIWIKSVFTLSRSDYQHIYEPILYGWNGNVKNHFFTSNRDIANAWEDLKEIKTTYDGKMTSIKFQGFEVKIKGKAEGEVIRRKQSTDIWRYDKPSRSALHPTMKPIALCSEAIKNSSGIGDIVLDPFLGSGSTAVAAQRMDRKCYGMELDPKFVDVIIIRLLQIDPTLQLLKDGKPIDRAPWLK